MSQWDYPGAKWWKFDFHTHTPASEDFMKGCSEEEKAKVIPEFWLQKFMEKGIDCVAITDHNTGQWLDKLKCALERLDSLENKPNWYRSITLFPGVEISVHGGIHLLAIFGKDKTQSDIDGLLGAVNYEGTKGCSDGVTAKTVTEVIDIIIEHGGLAVPAHVDKEKGIFEVLQGQTLNQVLDNVNIHAIELRANDYSKPQLYHDKKLQWTEVKGSDVHDFENERFGEFTWIKMDSPTIEGLKLALIDGAVSVNCNRDDTPNQHAKFVIEELSVGNAQYMGRPKVLSCKFSPFLNAIIGGRGTGKSTLLEFMRFVLRRDKELPESIKENKYFQVGDDDLLTQESVLSLIYRKDDTRYRLNWSFDGKANSLEVYDENHWQVESGEIESLFPVHIYSQKQIFELAKNPQALLNIIDKDVKVAFDNFEKQHKILTNQYKLTVQKLQELQEKISQKNKLLGELNDLNRQIEQIEKSGHKTILQNYRKSQQQLAVIKKFEDDWGERVDYLSEVEKKMGPENSGVHFLEGSDVYSAITQTNSKWHKINDELKNLKKEAKSIVDDWKQKKDQSEWMKVLKKEILKYEQVKIQLEQQGINPEKYPLLLQQQTQTKKELLQIDDCVLEAKKIKNKKIEIFQSIVENRKKLTENRKLFLKDILEGNDEVSISVKPFKEKIETVEKSLRDILCCDERFSKDIDVLISAYKNDHDYEALKNTIKKIIIDKNQAKDTRFHEHLKSLPQESLIDFRLWFPRDDLAITFGNSNQKIEQGSAGQKCAALLAFILSYGEEPLLLDQPEDDLDNELIYDLIVKQIRTTKSKRQIIIVTHNANIVVNGDAEMVLPLSVENGQSHINHAASIQDPQVRQKICDILEGGQYAFTQRYKRIHLES